MRNAYCSLIPVGTAEEFKLYKMLESERKGRGGGRIILNTQPSAFIKLCWEPEDRYKKACLYGKITLASVRKNKNAPLLIAILSKKDDYAAESKELLERYGARVISGDLPQEIDLVQAELEHALLAGLTPTMQTKKLINDGENLLARLAKEGLVDDAPWEGTDVFCIHHEIALDTVIKVEASQTASASGAAQYSADELADYARMARFDVLITTSLPQGKPVLALEYDGEEFHETPKGRRRDAKKAELCRLSQLPLMRLRCIDLPTRRDPASASDAGKSFDDEKRELFRMLVTYVTRVISFRKAQAIEQEQEFIDAEDRLNWEIEFGNSPERDDVDRLNYEEYIRKNVAKKNGVLSKVSYDSNEDGLTVSALVSDTVSGNKVTTIVSPRFHLRVIGRELHSIDQLMKSFALNWLHLKLISAGVCTRL